MVSASAVQHTNEEWRKNLRGDGWLKDLLSKIPDQGVQKEEVEEEESFWTGLAPREGTPGVGSDGRISSLAQLDLASCSRQGVLEYCENTWTLTETLFSALNDEEAYFRPPYHKLRHPFIFYIAHPVAFWVNKLRCVGLLKDPVNAYFEEIFETGVDEMSWDDLSKNEMQWPSLQEVWQYRREVHSLVKEIVLNHPSMDDLPISWEKPMWAIAMCCEHERIHLETSSVLMRELPLRLLHKPAQWPENAPFSMNPKAAANRFIDVPAGDVTVGKPHDSPSFGWDNEYGSRHFHVRPFSATAMLIRNGEFLQFVQEQGYHNPDFWSEDGWKWKSFRNAKWPSFWVPDGPAGLHKYKLRLLFEEVDLPLDLPAVVNWHEAKAYCVWLSKKDGLEGGLQYRLMTEVEHNRIKALDPDLLGNNPVLKESGQDMKMNRNLNLAYGCESPVDMFPPNRMGFHDIFGNLWQWCEDYFAALPESRGVHPIYDDFSTPCYDGQHNIILGGSFMSTGDEASTYARFHFRPHFFQHAGFRIVKPTGTMQTTHMDSPPPHVGSWNPSSTARTSDHTDRLCQALLTHYKKVVKEEIDDIRLPFDLGSFPATYVNTIIPSLHPIGELKSVLEIGCGVGGVCIELGKHFKSVVGIDINGEMINAAKEMLQDGLKSVAQREEGCLTTNIEVQSDLAGDMRSNIQFLQMDPCALQPSLGSFDCVLMTNVLEYIASPSAPLQRMGGARGVVKPGGFLVVACTGDWSEEYSGKQLWLEGRMGENGQKVELINSLSTILGERFQLKSTHWVPLVTPQTTRTLVTHVINISIWLRT